MSQTHQYFNSYVQSCIDAQNKLDQKHAEFQEHGHINECENVIAMVGYGGSGVSDNIGLQVN